MISSDRSWFAEDVEAALLAPTAMNQQKFRFEKAGDKVTATAGPEYLLNEDE